MARTLRATKMSLNPVFVNQSMEPCALLHLNEIMDIDDVTTQDLLPKSSRYICIY